jgi:hypothetical protein
VTIVTDHKKRAKSEFVIPLDHFIYLQLISAAPVVAMKIKAPFQV